MYAYRKDDLIHRFTPRSFWATLLSKLGEWVAMLLSFDTVPVVFTILTLVVVADILLSCFVGPVSCSRCPI